MVTSRKADIQHWLTGEREATTHGNLLFSVISDVSPIGTRFHSDVSLSSNTTRRRIRFKKYEKRITDKKFWGWGGDAGGEGEGG